MNPQNQAGLDGGKIVTASQVATRRSAAFKQFKSKLNEASAVALLLVEKIKYDHDTLASWEKLDDCSWFGDGLHDAVISWGARMFNQLETLEANPDADDNIEMLVRTLQGLLSGFSTAMSELSRDTMWAAARFEEEEVGAAFDVFFKELCACRKFAPHQLAA